MVRIAFDLDGVLANFFDKFIEIYNSRFPVKLSLDQITTYRFHDCLPKETADEIIKIFHEPEFFTNLSPTTNALEVVETVLNKGHVIEICTAPPSEHCPRAVEEKLNWVKLVFPKLTNCVSVTKNKFYFKTDILIDDYSGNIEAWCKEHPYGVGYLIDSPWNQNFILPNNCVRGVLVDVPAFVDKYAANKPKAAQEHLDELFDLWRATYESSCGSGSVSAWREFQNKMNLLTNRD